MSKEKEKKKGVKCSIFSFTNHRACKEKFTNKHSSISTKHIDATILKYICKYSQRWDLRLFSHGERSLHSYIKFLTQFFSRFFFRIGTFSYGRQ